MKTEMTIAFQKSRDAAIRSGFPAHEFDMAVCRQLPGVIRTRRHNGYSADLAEARYMAAVIVECDAAQARYCMHSYRLRKAKALRHAAR